MAGGGGTWYSRTLDILEPGARIWVNVPGHGYVAVGKVIEKARPVTEFKLRDGNGQMLPIHQVVSHTPDANVPPEQLEYYVPVNWLKAVPLDQAVKEKGFFGNQNTVAQPRSGKWVHTVERLKKRFEIPD